MGTAIALSLIVILVAIVVFVIFFGRLPALRHTPIRILNRFLVTSIPNFVLSLDNRLTGGKTQDKLSNFFHFVAYGRHPTVLIFFFILLSGGELLFLPQAWPLFITTHKICGTIAIVLPYLFLYLSAFSDPGYITAENLDFHLSLYPYDYALFHPGQVCRTCQIVKPARSKHCAVCNRCIAKLDHHCIFINGCVGYGNQRWFLPLLLTTGILVTYASCLGLQILGNIAMTEIPNWKRWKPAALTWNQWGDGWKYALNDATGVGVVTILTLLITPMVWALLAYQTYLVYCGTTTNESMKWSDWKYEMQGGFAFVRPLPQSQRRLGESQGLCTRWPAEAAQILVHTDDGSFPAENANMLGVGPWKRIYSLTNMDNIYDVGMWDNLRDVFIPQCAFGRGKMELPSMASLTKRSKGGLRED